MLEGEGSSDLSVGPLSEQVVAIVAAHPDDEVIGAGGLLPKLRRPLLIHVTDGAPRNGHDARAAGFDSCQAYAETRRRELLAALELAGIPPQQTCHIGVSDQEASLSLVGLAGRLAALFLEARPAIVLTHPYEGGHPDHDAAAFAVHAAARLLNAPPRLCEFTSYHARDGRMATGEFLGAGGSTVRLPLEARRLKERMFECFATQQHVLRSFQTSYERFRPAPLYRFTEPPHAGQLHYERFDWGMTGERWRTLARRALVDLQLQDPL